VLARYEVLARWRIGSACRDASSVRLTPARMNRKSAMNFFWFIAELDLQLRAG